MDRTFTLKLVSPADEYGPEDYSTSEFDSFGRVMQAIAYNRAVRNMAGFPPARYSVSSIVK